MKNNIVLIGFMGCGKTSVGALLSEKLDYPFVDTDQMIEKKEGTSISNIFSEKGEPYFRELETKTLETMTDDLSQCIISTGGGLPLKEINGKILSQLGFVVYLKVSKETVYHRLKGDTTRPLLMGNHVLEKIDILLTFRDPIYEVSAHLVVNTEDKSLDDISDEVIRNYKIIFPQRV